MTALSRDIAEFDRIRTELEAKHFGEWAVVQGGKLVSIYSDFDAAACDALDKFDVGPYLIRQIGAAQTQLPGGMVFTPAHVFGPSRI